jgi:hypothetical protein
VNRRASALALGLCLVGFACDARADPGVDYMLQCQGCHLADGGGSPGAVPPLTGLMGKFLWVPRGREYLVRVPGSSQSPLSDAELAAVLNWMIRRFGPEQAARDFTAFSADEVAGYRDPPLTDVETLRAELLRQISRIESSRAP